MTSAVSIGNPGAVVGAGTGHSQATSGAVAGAAQGAAAGAAVGSIVPGIGNAIGAVVGGVVGGVVGAVAGWFGGGAMDKATKHKKKAARWIEAGKDREAALARANMLRQYRAARASALVSIASEEGGTLGSATGAVSAMGSQYAFGDAFFGGQVHIQKSAAKHLSKAAKATNKANTIQGYMDAAASIASTFANYGMNFGSTPTAVGTSGSAGLSSTGSGISMGSSNTVGGIRNPFSPPGI